MAGIIVGIFGLQRSGKSLMAYMLSDLCYKKGLSVYTNVDCDKFNKISKLSDLEINSKNKVLWLDETQYYLDSRTWKDNTESSIFFNSIGKQNILLIMTTIRPDMLEKRIREQQNYMIFAANIGDYFKYRVIDVYREKRKDFYLKKNDDLFKKLKYDSSSVPDYVVMDWDKQIKIKGGDYYKGKANKYFR